MIAGSRFRAFIVGISVATRIRMKPANETTSPSPKTTSSKRGKPTVEATRALETTTPIMPTTRRRAFITVTTTAKYFHNGRNPGRTPKGICPPAWVLTGDFDRYEIMRKHTARGCGDVTVADLVNDG